MLALLAAGLIGSGAPQNLRFVQDIHWEGSLEAVVMGPTGMFTPIRSLGDERYVGMDEPSGLRFDLDQRGIVARGIRDRIPRWRFNCGDATLKSGKLLCLKENGLYTVDLRGRIVRQLWLGQSSIRWQFLDQNARYALGFRSRPDFPDRQSPLFMVDLQSFRVRQLPVTYDLGGHVNPKVLSSATGAVVQDVFFTYFIQAKGLVPLRKSQGVYGTALHDANGDLYLLQRKLGSEESFIYSTSRRSVIAKSANPVTAFVEASAPLHVYRHEGDRVRIYRVTGLFPRDL